MSLRMIITPVVIYVAYGLILFIFQRSILFPGQHIDASKLSAPAINNLKRIWLKTSVGRVEAWYMPVRDDRGDKEQPVVIFAHGNYELIDYFSSDLLRYNEMGVSVLMVEFPGYGRSEGYPSQSTIGEAFIMAYDWLIENGVNKTNIIAHGRSVGGGPVCYLARERDIRALILQSTFSSVRQFAWRYLLPPFLVRDPFDNLSVVKSFGGPILIFHGRYDEIIPYKNAVELYNSSRDAKLITYNCRHNDCPPDWGSYWQSIRGFLEDNSIISR
jgi:fermentation-respiration switch protein FrsA (DUF1100 family)